MTNEIKAKPVNPDPASIRHGGEEEKSHAFWKRFLDEAVVRVGGTVVEHGDPVALFHTEEIDITVEVDPERVETLRLGEGNNGNLELTLSPDFNTPVKPVDRKFTWRIKPVKRVSGRILLVLYSPEVLLPLEFWWWVLSRRLDDEAEVKIDGETPASGHAFFKNASRLVTITPKSDGAIAGYPLTIKSVVDTPLLPTDVKIEPDTAQKIHKWSVTNTALYRSGKCRLSVGGAGMNSISVEESKFLSSDLREEASLLVDGNKMPPNGLDFITGRTYNLSLDYKNLELLEGIPLALDVTSAELDPHQFDSDPPRLELSDKHQWAFTPRSRQSGVFKIKLFNEEKTAELLTPTNRLTASKYEMQFFHILGGGKTYLPRPPAEYKLIPGVFIVMVDILGAGNVPVGKTSVKFTCPPLPDATVDTNEEGVALTPFIFAPARHKVTAIATVEGEECRTELLIDARV